MSAESEWIEYFHGDLGIAFSSIVRGMLVPTPGKELFVADFSKVEVAGLWWLADNEPGLKILRAGKDPYKYQAAANTKKSYDEIADDGLDRQLGKAQILGAGFRMGWKRFRETANDQYGLKLTNKESVAAIKSYREANPAVVELWEAYEDAAVQAVQSRKPVEAGKCVFEYNQNFLWVGLPSGRRLAYYQPSIVWATLTYEVLEEDSRGREIIVTKTGRPKETLQYMGVGKDKKTLVPERMHGGIWAENNTQAMCRDLMMEASLRLESSGYQILLTVHDEIIAEKAKGSVEEFRRIMCERPKWTDKKLPIDAKAFSCLRYQK